jgi:hypothetical protein
VRTLAALLLLAGLVAGCSSPATTPPAGASDATHATEGLLSSRAGVAVPLPAAGGTFAASVFRTHFHRGEPTVGLTSDGVLFATAGLDVPGNPPGTGGGVIARSTDGGATWAIVQDPLRNGKADVDPWLWVDPATNRVYNAPLYAGCSWAAWSDDHGATWDGNPIAGCGLPGHDHQKLTGGPPPAGVSTQGYPSLLYYAYNNERPDGGSWVSVSRDGGRTFSLGTQVHPGDACQAGINGPVAVAADGTAYLPKPTCDGPAIAHSTDGGATWSAPVTIQGPGMPVHLVTLHAAVDSAGTVYVLWTGADERLWLSHSTDKGVTWSEPALASAPGLGSVVFSAITADGPGRIGIGYVATTSDPATWPSKDPSVAPDETVWHAFLATSADGDAVSPTFVAQRLTTDQDPVQRGCVWLGGGANPCRNLRDFVDVQQAGGRLAFAYADGCDACSTAAQRLPAGETVVAVQEAGPSLADGAPLVALRGLL